MEKLSEIKTGLWVTWFNWFNTQYWKFWSKSSFGGKKKGRSKRSYFSLKFSFFTIILSKQLYLKEYKVDPSFLQLSKNVSSFSLWIYVIVQLVNLKLFCLFSGLSILQIKTKTISHLYKTCKFTKYRSSKFGLIEQTLDLSCI